jgi:hypothetical protein
VTRFGRLLLTAALTAGAVVTTAATRPAEIATAQSVAPREHRVAVFADSVGLGARHSVPAAFPADWEVNLVGEPARFVEQLERGDCFWTLTNQRCDVASNLVANPHWFGDHVVIAAGYNYPYWDPARFDRSIDSMIERLRGAGVRHIYWVTLREVDPQYISGAAWRQVQPYYWYFPRVNEHLRRALDRHPDLTLVDWAAAANRPGITYDAIHLNDEGAALYAELIRSAVAATATKVPDGATTRIPIPDAEGVTAVAVNLTTVRPRHRGFLTAYDCDRPRPDVSSHNFVREQTVAHATIVPVGPSGEICVYTSTATNLIVDLTGRLTGDVADPVARRVLDTRSRDGGRPTEPGEPVVVDVGTTDVAAFTITAIGATERGFVRVAPCAQGEDTSNLNMNGPDPVPNAAIVRPAADGTVCVTTSTRAHLVLDRLATLPDGAGLVVEPARRVADTRPSAPVAAGGTLRLRAAQLGVDADTTGVLLNLTATRSDAGYVTASACDVAPETSSLNLAPGAVVANFVVIAPGADGDICLRTTAGTDLIVDVQGRIGSGFAGAPSRLLDTRG